MLLYGVRIASISGNDVLYIYRDRLGSVVATSRSGGRPGASYRYTPYGAQDLALGDTAAAASDLGHNGARKLTGGLLHLNARVYDPRLRRFLQPDNVDLLRYTYAAGDPANRTDPTGHWWNSGKTHFEFHVLWNERALVTGSWAAGTSADPFVAHVKQFEEASGDARDEIARMAKNAQPAFGTKTWAQYDAEVVAQNTTAPPDPEGKGKAGTAGDAADQKCNSPCASTDRSATPSDPDLNMHCDQCSLSGGEELQFARSEGTLGIQAAEHSLGGAMVEGGTFLERVPIALDAGPVRSGSSRVSPAPMSRTSCSAN